MENRLPKFHETFLPILEVLNDGRVIHYSDLLKEVRDRFYSNLPEDILSEKTKGGDPLILNRINWGKVYLKQGKMIHQPERAMVQITPKGKDVLARGSLSLPDLLHDQDFLMAQSIKEIDKKGEIVSDKGASPEDLMDYGSSTVESQVKEELLNKLKTVDPFYFEKVILQLLNKMGYGEFLETPKSGDGGIDGIINQDQLGLDKIYVQAKRYNDHKVRETDIRNFIGAMSGDTTRGIFATTSSFDDAAIKKAKDAHHKIILIDGLKLVDLMYKFGVGVQTRNTYDIKKVDEDFFEIEGN